MYWYFIKLLQYIGSHVVMKEQCKAGRVVVHVVMKEQCKAGRVVVHDEVRMSCMSSAINILKKFSSYI